MKFALPNGQVILLPVKKSEVVISTPQPDKKKDYGNLVLELGTQFFLLLRMCKSPSWNDMMPLLKMLLVTFKANNSQAKYALELLRFLVIQHSLLSEKNARQMFYQLFVNTKGRHDTHVPCDLVMEWQVRDQKRHIKHMFSNKTEQNILTRAEALGGLENITNNYDDDVGVRQRVKTHKNASAISDERILIQSLQNVKPFQSSPRRFHKSFSKVKPTMTQLFNSSNFHGWFHKHKNLFNP